MKRFYFLLLLLPFLTSCEEFSKGFQEGYNSARNEDPADLSSENLNCSSYKSDFTSELLKQQLAVLSEEQAVPGMQVDSLVSLLLNNTSILNIETTASNEEKCDCEAEMVVDLDAEQVNTLTQLYLENGKSEAEATQAVEELRKRLSESSLEFSLQKSADGEFELVTE